MAFMKKWGLVLKVLVFVSILLAIKRLIDFLDLDVAFASPLITALVGGVIFTIAIIFTGTLADYKESEKIPGELATSIKALYRDSNILPANNEKDISEMQAHIRELLHAINSNFRNNAWELEGINSAMDSLDKDIKKLAEKGLAPPLIVKLRTELTNIDKVSNRIKTITETTFIPAAYGIAELAVAAVLSVLLFVKTEPYLEGLALIGATSALLIGLILLIKDMDNPFEVGKNTYADIDLSLLWNLEDYLKNK
jgi:phage-related protein